jgi:hypothetical protein
VPAVLLLVAGLLLLFSANHYLQAHLLRQNAEPRIPVNIIGLALGSLVFVGLGSFFLGMIKGSKARA